MPEPKMLNGYVRVKVHEPEGPVRDGCLYKATLVDRVVTAAYVCEPGQVVRVFDFRFGPTADTSIIRPEWIVAVEESAVDGGAA